MVLENTFPVLFHLPPCSCNPSSQVSALQLAADLVEIVAVTEGTGYHPPHQSCVLVPTYNHIAGLRAVGPWVVSCSLGLTETDRVLSIVVVVDILGAASLSPLWALFVVVWHRSGFVVIAVVMVMAAVLVPVVMVTFVVVMIACAVFRQAVHIRVLSDCAYYMHGLSS